MNLKSLLDDALRDHFKAVAVVEKIKMLIESKVEKELTQKYKDVTLSKDGMEFELFAVSADCRVGLSGFEKRHVQIALHYTCKSKLPKDKRERLEQIKKNYDGSLWLRDWNMYKYPITHTLDYKISIDEAFSGSITLRS